MGTQQYDAIGERWDDVRLAPTVPVERASLLGLLGDLRGRAVLDLACGTGFYTRKFRELGAERVIGTDVSAEMIAAARKHGDAGVEYRVADAADHPRFTPFDTVTAAFLLNYATDENGLTEMARTAFDNLARDGRFVGVTQNPHYRLGATDTRKYGYEFLPRGDGPLGREIRVRTHTGSSVEFDTRIIEQDVYERCLGAAGFTTTDWIPARVPDQEIERCSAGFWADFLENPPIVLFRCTRST